MSASEPARVKRDDIAGRNPPEVPYLFVLISFGRVVWLLEHAGAPSLSTHRSIRAAIRCAENIARRWLWEHQEREESARGVNFPGDTAFPSNLMPAAIWLGTREYAGVWLHGGTGTRYGDRETFGMLGDSRLVTLGEAMRIFGINLEEGVVWRPHWYWDHFEHWTVNFTRYVRDARPTLEMENTRPWQEMSWLGLVGCPYPYVTASWDRVTLEFLDNPSVERVSRSQTPVARSLRPRWGAYLTDLVAAQWLLDMNENEDARE